ncbi:MAG: type II toxin-antitoxin system VapC family toxin [Terracidiphilus sp.]|jgi:predicted nucleic acid-binding protein
MNGYLLDTNIPSELMRPQPDVRVVAWLESADDDQLFFSVVSLGEVVKGVSLLASGRKRNDLEQWLETTLRPWFGARILSVDEVVARRWGVLTARLERKGRKLKVADGMIAATALVHDLSIVTSNVKDFAGTGANVINPWLP